MLCEKCNLYAFNPEFGVKMCSYVDDGSGNLPCGYLSPECDGDCDYCKYRRVVSGTDSRIDREPVYYCALDKE